MEILDFFSGLRREVAFYINRRQKDGLAEQSIGKNSKLIFLSHASEDIDFAIYLHQDLFRFGFGTWLDKIELRSGNHLRNELLNYIQSVDFICIILSPSSVNSSWCAWEIETAQKFNKRIIPILFQRCRIPDSISGLLYADFTNSYFIGFQTLVESLGSGSLVGVNLKRQLCIHYIRSAISYETERDFETAEGIFKEAIKADETYAEAYYDYSVFLVSMNRKTEAISLLLKVLDIDSGHVGAMASLVEIYKGSHNFGDAIKYCRKILNAAEKMGKKDYLFYGHKTLGELFMMSENYRESAIQLQTALISTTNQIEQNIILFWLFLVLNKCAPRGIAIAYLEEFIIAERRIKPKIDDYIMVIDFFCSNDLVHKAADYHARLFSNYPNEHELKYQLDLFIQQSEIYWTKYKEVHPGIKYVYTNYRMNYETARANLYANSPTFAGEMKFDIYNDGTPSKPVPFKGTDRIFNFDDEKNTKGDLAD